MAALHPFGAFVGRRFKRIGCVRPIKVYVRYHASHPYTYKQDNITVPNILISMFLDSGPGQIGRYSDSLRAGRSGNQILVGVTFSALVQTDPGAHPPSYTMGTGFFPGVKRPGHGDDHPPPSSAEVKERVELYLYSPSGPSCPVLG